MTRWNDALLDEMRNLGDPAADAVVAAIFARGQVDAVNALLAELIRNEQHPDAGAFPEVQQFLLATAALPPWADAAQIAAGERVFLEWGLVSLSILACASLPECYVLGDVASVLGRTQQLEAHVNRRMPETVMMVLAVMDRGGMGPQGSGIRVTQKVRLMHAAIRHLVLQSPSAPRGSPSSLGEAYLACTWDPARGLPISQEDLAVVMQTFSHVVLRGWRDLGVEVSAADQRAYVHCWNVVGHVLGIDDRFLARDPDDAREMFEAIKRRRMADTADGRDLTAALLSYAEGFAPEPRFVFRPISRILMHTLLSPETCALLRVPRLKWMERIGHSLLLQLVWAVNKFGGDLFRAVPGAGGLAALFSKAVVGELIAVQRSGARPPFEIPESLASAWRVAPAQQAPG